MAESLINIEVRGQTIEKKDYRSSSGIWTFGRELLKYRRTRRRDLDAEPLRPQGDTPRQRRQEHEQKIKLPHCGIS